MPLEAPSSRPEERARLVDFLLRAFSLPPDAPFVRPELLAWKYDVPRPDWSGPRSYVWNDASGIAAHACMCPVTFYGPAAPVGGSYLIDWAAGRRFPGAGVMLLRKLSGLTQTLIAIGGSADTRAILPKLGYKIRGRFDSYARVVRPWLQFRTAPCRGWKAPLRLARNFTWSRSPLPRAHPGWRAESVARFDESLAPLLATRAASPFLSTCRSVPLMNYFLACPAVALSASLLYLRGVLRGWFVLARAGGQGRIADIWVDSPDPAGWMAAVALAARAAATDPAVAEIVASVSIPPAREALLRHGFRHRGGAPIFLLDPQTLLDTSRPLHVSPIESDVFYLYDAAYPYLT